MTTATTHKPAATPPSDTDSFRHASGQVGETIVGTASIALNVTARREAEAALRASDERFRQVVENIREVFWMREVDTQRTVYVSPGYAAIWGRASESLGNEPDSWPAGLHEVDRDRVARAVKTKLILGTYDETYRIVRPDGAIRWVRDRGFPVREKNGVVRRVCGVAEDVTEHKEHEEKSLRAQRLESLGMLAAGIAHDLANILAPVAMAAPLLRVNASQPSDLRLLHTLERCAERGGALVRQMLGFVHGIGGEPRIMQIKHLLDDVIGFVTETFPKSIVLRESVPNDLWPILANPTQIHQVVLNLCVNARDAMPHGGTLSVRAENLRLDEAAARRIEGASAGAWLMIEIEDTGIGISTAVMAQMWDPFFTTKSAGNGTGLGLTTVRGIVKSHQGCIMLETGVGRGTTFRVYLPAAEVGSFALGDGSSPPAVPGRGEVILLVDDEESIRNTADAVFTRAGYAVLAASDGANAAALFVKHAASIALVITDSDMPGMNGEAFARIVRGFSPSTKILSISGLHAGAHRGGVAADSFLAKPFTAQALLDAVGGLLGRERTEARTTGATLGDGGCIHDSVSET